MNLIQIGQAVINFDLVTCVRDLSDRDSTGKVTRGLLRLEFSGADPVEVSKSYNELSGWLASNVTKIAS